MTTEYDPTPTTGGLVTRAQAARLAGYGHPESWTRLVRQGKAPRPVIRGRWRLEELKAWIRAGCPPQSAWRWPETLKN